MRHALLSLLGAAMVTLGGVALPASAAEVSSGLLNVLTTSAVSPTSSVGTVSVTIAASSPLTSLVVSVYSDGADQLDLPMSDFIQPGDDGDGQYGTWTLSIPITTAQLNLGAYQVMVSATDSGGDSLTNVPVGPLDFLNVVEYPGFTDTGTSFSYDNQDITFAGKAVVLAPDGTTTPLASQTLTVAGQDGDPTVETGADGSFSLTFPVTQSGYCWLYNNGDADTEANSTDPINLTVRSLTVHITAKLRAARVKQGVSDSLAGTVTYTDRGTTKPLAGDKLSLYDGAYSFGETPAATAVTNSHGHFTFRAPTRSSADLTVMSASTLYFRQAQATANLAVAERNFISGFRATLTPFAVVNVSARCVTATSGRARIEYAPKSTGPWKSLGTLLLTDTGTSSCFRGGRYGTSFTGHFRARLASAYYRAVFSATPDWQQAVSKVVQLHRLLTKITSFNVTPRSVGEHGEVTVSGRLWGRGASGKWRGYGHRKLIVVFKYQGTWYRYKGEPTTSASGWFSRRVEVYGSSPFFAQYNGDSTHFASASKHLEVTAADTTGAVPGPAAVRQPQRILR